MADDLGDLRERLRATREAAERFVDGPPPQGWATLDGDAQRDTAREIEALLTLARAVRDVVPPELWDELRELVRKLLLVLRTLVDAALEQLEPREGGPAAPSATPDSAVA